MVAWGPVPSFGGFTVAKHSVLESTLREAGFKLIKASNSGALWGYPEPQDPRRWVATVVVAHKSKNGSEMAVSHAILKVQRAQR